MVKLCKIPTLAVLALGSFFLVACSDDSSKQTSHKEEMPVKEDVATKESAAATIAQAAVTEKQSLPEAIEDVANFDYATLRDLDLSQTKESPRMMPLVNKDIKSVRNYPEQPPIIPHKIDGYQVDARHNQCLDCHRRVAVGVSQAPMVSISHFMDRDGQFLASISSRRYFCNQCHVAQRDVGPLVENTFVDVDTMIKQDTDSSPGGK